MAWLVWFGWFGWFGLAGSAGLVCLAGSASLVGLVGWFGRFGLATVNVLRSWLFGCLVGWAVGQFDNLVNKPTNRQTNICFANIF